MAAEWKSWHCEMNFHPDVKPLFCMETYRWVHFCSAENNFFQWFLQTAVLCFHIFKSYGAKQNQMQKLFFFCFQREQTSCKSNLTKWRTSRTIHSTATKSQVVCWGRTITLLGERPVIQPTRMIGYWTRWTSRNSSFTRLSIGVTFFFF